MERTWGCGRGRLVVLFYLFALGAWLAMMFLQLVLLDVQLTRGSCGQTGRGVLDHLWGRQEETQDVNLVSIRLNLMELRRLLTHPCPGIQFHWMRLRITRMWQQWRRGVEEMLQEGKISISRRKKNILLHFGTLAQGNRLDETAFKGGPLGELVQWSDLVATLYILGHDVTITTEINQLGKLMADNWQRPVQASLGRGPLPYDLIFTDIHGYKQFRNTLAEAVFTKSRCLFRILDSFGTEAEFNYRPYATGYHGNNRSNTCEWGCLHLRLQQFYTMFPHTPDNSFLGFVIERHNARDGVKQTIRIQNQSLVYAKREYMWEGKQAFIDVIREFFDVHATSELQAPRHMTQSPIPEYVHNHYVLLGDSYQALLQQSKIFVGLGFPYEGPAPLEAIAMGTVFINPRFHPPHSRSNTAFFAEKPTNREVTSQHPYAEDIGDPHVYTVDINNHTQLRATLLRVLTRQQEVPPFLPFEFTVAGMLERMNYYIENQDFCSNPIRSHVPRNAVQGFVGAEGKSCNDVCRSNGRFCENTRFNSVNNMDFLRARNVTCSTVVSEAGLVYPSFVRQGARKDCFFQQNDFLFNCASKLEKHNRLCACRTFKKEQVALCHEC
ncbi:alpha-1,6-mannosylglycoprotein 6-beta-N-acetylglucosaminyltransferase A [Lingula anatina]|uniref:alpha-1,6-mannosyl-glycoprotein 6-beta-N-acetylglucosaminyltransferase n=1 Tax=Lingula anatina TaxID=7574 RepID=A0A1S3JYD4_LINAN|nr:alpha-1,6-mannosylglycoprotein 6-beta-N-acetylglucosaminyltransferase A [Lingula anatina]XP_013415409.1 alpha-1,6-mannosylglycoprotein 6-beta-N-acetylglucosaminyltransferase A [Lingula anatina]|eukprot:XP_013415408.1 alpha-1,6-mannosylglycoprotein 6-beta-N-acetylglucosaminyltransferase A [Lingula anatina]